MEMDKRTPIDRLNYEGNLDPVVGRLCTAYRVGELTDFSVIDVGYEDCNVVIATQKDKYVAKIFSKGRTPQDITRYSTIMEKAVEAGINHPPLLKTHEGDVVFTDTKANSISLVLMKFIKGKTFFELDRTPNEEELKAIIEQAARINNINHHPSYIFDSWAIPNIQIMFDKIKPFLKQEDIPLVEKTIARYNEIPIKTLPRCLVHGDLIKTNILKAENGDIYILDFSVANWYPRIQELAVITANLLHDVTNSMSLTDRTELVANEYDKFNKLTPEERKWLYPFALAGVAMGLMGAHQEKHINRNGGEETEYWLKLGREGLKRELTI